MLRKGRWNGEQIIPQWFVEGIAHSSSPHGLQEMRWGMDSGSFAEGWQLPQSLNPSSRETQLPGIPPDARVKIGSGGQFLGYVPSLDLVLARHTGGRGDWTTWSS